ncbi:HD domain-containing protein [Candidatus Micrarchaeota archaeon]|nr:HD domain-containing protein [Candidatus Micrarchaeota archaeon]MBU1681511.1 HD domain-containing protein [Candidatus Micrarchaeota archaeon]
MNRITDYIFEVGMLKRVARSGWWAEKIKHPESVADHSHRTAVIAFILAKLEGMSENQARKLCTAAVFHDMHETRLLDLNKITARYIDIRKIEDKVEADQVAGIPKEVSKSIISALDSLTDEEKTILKDADSLECAFQAKEYLDIGHAGTASWIKNIGLRLKTKSAKKIFSKMKTQDSNSWWKGLKKLD